MNKCSDDARQIVRFAILEHHPNPVKQVIENLRALRRAIHTDRFQLLLRILPWGYSTMCDIADLKVSISRCAVPTLVAVALQHRSFFKQPARVVEFSGVRRGAGRWCMVHNFTTETSATLRL